MSDNPAFIEKLRSGDPEAVDQMIRSEISRVYNLCYRLSRHTTDAEDLTQETFVHAVRGLPNFKGESMLSTWLYRIAVNVWKNRVRYERHRHMTKHLSLSAPKGPEDDEPVEMAGTDRAPEEWAALHADHRLLLEAMKRLDDADQAVLVLRDLEDRSYEEIADMLKMNPGTLKSRISRAREKLRVAFHRIEGLAL